MTIREKALRELQKEWAQNPRWQGIKRDYSAEDVIRLRGSMPIEHTLAKRGSEKLWHLVNNEPFVNTLGRQPCHAAGQGRTQGHLSVTLAGCR